MQGPEAAGCGDKTFSLLHEYFSLSALPPCEEDKNIPRVAGMLPAPSEGRGIAWQSQNPRGVCQQRATGTSKCRRGTQLFKACCSLLQIPSEKSQVVLLFPPSLFHTHRIKRPYFLQNIVAARRIKSQCLKALYFCADFLVLGRASAPKATKAMSSPKCHRCPPGWGIHLGMLRKGQEEKNNPPKLTLSSPESPQFPCCAIREPSRAILQAAASACFIPNGEKSILNQFWKIHGAVSAAGASVVACSWLSSCDLEVRARVPAGSAADEMDK